jgi:hypothetical protein
MADEMNGEREALGLSLEQRGGVWVVQFAEGGCRPASIVEVNLWQALQAGRASLAASAGSEPVAWGIFDSEGFYEVALDEGSGQRFVDHYNKRREGPLKPFSLRALYTHPSPPEGMAGLPTRNELALQLLVAGGFVTEKELAKALAIVDATCPALAPPIPASEAKEL